MTRKEVARLVGWTAANFPGKQKEELRTTAELWLKMLTDVPFDVAEKALIKVLSTARFWPTVGDIRTAAIEITAPAAPQAAEAYGMLTDAIKRNPMCGVSKEAKAEVRGGLLPAIARVADWIGWDRLCYGTDQERIYRDFVFAYREQSCGNTPALLEPPIDRLVHILRGDAP